MDIVFVIADISAYGGTARVTTEVASMLSGAGHKVTIVSLFGTAAPWFDLPDAVTVRAAGLAEARRSVRRATAI